MSSSVEIYVSDWSIDGYASWYDFSNAFYDTISAGYSEAAYMPLYTMGCLRDDMQTNDCTWACQDVTSLWNSEFSMYTMHNCLAYPIIVNLAQQGVHFTSETTDWAKRFNMHISPNQTAPAAIMNGSAIESCIDAFCNSVDDEDKPSGCTDGSSPIQYQNLDGDQRTDSNGSLPFISDVCMGIDAQINPDIAGIGVFISYIMQIVLVLLIWFTFHITQDWYAYGSFVWLKFIRKSDDAWKQARAMQEHKKATSLARKDLVSAMRDFQITQIFFMLAVQIATLIAINRPDYFDSKSWQQFWNNVGILYDLAFGGVLPVLLVQILLRRAGERGWYTLFASIMSVSLSAATWFRTYSFQTASYLHTYIKPKNPSLTQCAGVPPTKYCYSSDWFYYNSVASKKAIPMLVFCLVVLFVISLDQIRVFKQRPRQEKTPPEWKRYHYTGRNVFELVRDNSMGKAMDGEIKRPKWKKPLHVAERLIVLFTECALVALTIILLKDYGRILVPADPSFKLLDRSAWSFGQVIAVTIWLPVLCKYLWNLTETVAKVHQKGKVDEAGGIEKLARSESDLLQMGEQKPARVVAMERHPLSGYTDTFNSLPNSER